MVGHWLPLHAQAPQSVPLLPPYLLPKSPTVSELPRVDKAELVNLMTGAAQLHIPLVTVSAGPLQLPVALAYSYSGLQVYQPRELVGLGWTLQADATIVRHVNGLLDQATSGTTIRYNPDTVAAHSQQFMNRAMHNAADTGPDIYSFSLPGGPTGNFLVRDTTVILVPRQPLQIRLLGGLNKGFQISLEDGRRYHFEAGEKTHSGGEFGLGLYVSAWHLTRIISADNADTVRLHYKQYDAPESTPRRFAVTTSQYAISGSTDGGGDCHGNYTWHNVIAFGTHIAPQYLDSITTRGTCVAFLRDSVTHACRQVRLWRTLGSRQETRRFTLFQSYFDATGAGLSSPRLRLDSVQESGPGTRLPPYRLRYLAGTLPSRSSAAVDYWGYYNGASNGDATNSTNGPALLEDPQLGNLMPNRKPAFSYAVAGALLQVTYPTGGSSAWEYESNRMTMGKPAASGPQRDTTRLELGTYYDAARTARAPTGNKYVTYSAATPFTLAEAGTLVLLLDRVVQDGNAYFNSHYPDFFVWQHLPSGDSTLVTTSANPVQAYSVAYQQPMRRFQIPCAPGRYSIQLYCESNESFTGTLKVPYTFIPPPGPLEGPPGAGVRVHRTTTAAAGGRPLHHTYEYLVPDSTQAYGSSVQLTSSGVGSAKKTVEVYSMCVTCEFLNLSSDASQLGDDLSRYPFYYRCVTVREDSTQGATTSYFLNLDTQFNEVVLTRRQVFRQSPTKARQLQLVQEERYEYAPDSLTIYPLIRPYLQRAYRASVLCTSMQNQEVYAVEQAGNLVVGLGLLRVTQQTQYAEAGPAYSTLTRQHYQQQRLVHTATQTSAGWRSQRYKRLRDYSPSLISQAMQANGFNPLIETQTWQKTLAGMDSVLVAGQLTLYEPRWRNPARSYRLRLAQPLASLDQESKANGLFTNLLSDSRYEPTASVRYAADTGDLLEELPAAGEPTAYLLGYDRTLLIAEVQRASYAQIAYTSFEPRASGRWRYDSTGTHRQAGGRTGRWAYRLDGTAGITRPGLPAGDYELTYWQQGLVPVHCSLGVAAVSGTATLLTSAPGGWYQYRRVLHLGTPASLILDVPAGTGAPVLVDEVRLYPVGARMRSFTHEPLVGETSLTGPDDRTLTYEYDALGRLSCTRDEQGRILSQQQYHYAGQ